jgi:hypothetical protein
VDKKQCQANACAWLEKFEALLATVKKQHQRKWSKEDHKEQANKAKKAKK